MAVCLGLVALAAEQTSFLSPTAISAARYPGWLSGPLGHLWPWPAPAKHSIKLLESSGLGLLFVAYLLVLREAGKVDPRWIVGAVLVLHVIFLLAPPLQYTDVFNYINYGRMGVVHHLNPYAIPPRSEPHGDLAYVLSNWHNLRSPYGPLFTLVSYAVVPLGVAGSLWAFKVIVGLCSLGLLTLVWRLARLLGHSPQRAVALVGLNPIVLVWGLGGVHNDFIMMLLVFAAVYLLVAAFLTSERSLAPASATAGGLLLGRELAAGVLLVAAVGIKLSAVVFLPLAVALARRRRLLLAGVCASALVLIAASLLAFGPHLGGVRAQSTLVSPEGLPNLLGIALGLGGATSGLRAALTVLAAIVILLAARRALRHPSEAMSCAAISASALILTLGWSAPWYVLWGLPFAALALSSRWRRMLVVYTVYALIASSPNVAEIEQALHFYPRADRLGREHVHEFEYLGAK